MLYILHQKCNKQFADHTLRRNLPNRLSKPVHSGDSSSNYNAQPGDLEAVSTIPTCLLEIRKLPIITVILPPPQLSALQYHSDTNHWSSYCPHELRTQSQKTVPKSDASLKWGPQATCSSDHLATNLGGSHDAPHIHNLPE